MTGIYFIKSKCKPERIYVGSAVDVNNRFYRHKSDLQNNKHHSKKLQNHCNKYGFDDLEFAPMVIGVNPEELIQLEQDCLDSFKPYFNICKTAGSPLGRKHTEETKKKLSIKNKGVGIGRKLSKETCKKMSEMRKGVKRSEETKIKISETRTGKYRGENSYMFGKEHSIESRKKMSIAASLRIGDKGSMYGKTHSKETRKKMSEIRKGKWGGEKHYSYDHTIYHFSHPDHGERFCTRFELRTEFRIQQGSLFRLITGKYKTARGWKFIK